MPVILYCIEKLLLSFNLSFTPCNVFTRAAGDVLAPDPSLVGGGGSVSDYEILMIILTFGLIVVGVLNVNHRLKPSDPAVS